MVQRYRPRRRPKAVPEFRPGSGASPEALHLRPTCRFLSHPPADANRPMHSRPSRQRSHASHAAPVATRSILRRLRLTRVARADALSPRQMPELRHRGRTQRGPGPRLPAARPGCRLRSLSAGIAVASPVGRGSVVLAYAAAAVARSADPAPQVSHCARGFPWPRQQVVAGPAHAIAPAGGVPAAGCFPFWRKAPDSMHGRW